MGIAVDLIPSANLLSISSHLKPQIMQMIPPIAPESIKVVFVSTLNTILQTTITSTAANKRSSPCFAVTFSPASFFFILNSPPFFESEHFICDRSQYHRFFDIFFRNQKDSSHNTANFVHLSTTFLISPPRAYFESCRTWFFKPTSRWLPFFCLHYSFEKTNSPFTIVFSTATSWIFCASI